MFEDDAGYTLTTGKIVTWEVATGEKVVLVDDAPVYCPPICERHKVYRDTLWVRYFPEGYQVTVPVERDVAGWGVEVDGKLIYRQPEYNQLYAPAGFAITVQEHGQEDLP